VCRGVSCMEVGRSLCLGVWRPGGRGSFDVVVRKS
jgi:hypothetical protein